MNTDDYRAALKRMLETGGECGASLWLANRKTGEFSEWATCTESPGHGSQHLQWSERDSDVWVEWDDAGAVKAHYTDLSDVQHRPEPSPWTDTELAARAEVDGAA